MDYQYKKFTKYYDEIIRGNGYSLEDEVWLIDECIWKFWNGWKKILEFACGSWVVASELQKKWYITYWVDISESMLEKAEKLIWKDSCRIGDMTSIDLWEKFDIVLCNYNSVCHLTSWEDWSKCFANAHRHLVAWGVFIFDINTVEEFENIARDFAQFYTIKEDTVCLEMRKKKWLYEWVVKMFIKNDDGCYERVIERIPELSFGIETIKKELDVQWFVNLHQEDFHKWKVDTESERVYFIAQKK